MDVYEKWLLDHGYANRCIKGESLKETDWNNLHYVSDAIKLYVLELEDMLISSLPYITDSYDDETISASGHNHAKSLEKRIMEHLTTAST